MITNGNRLKFWLTTFCSGPFLRFASYVPHFYFVRNKYILQRFSPFAVFPLFGWSVTHDS
jgi:hypothetical protein